MSRLIKIAGWGGTPRASVIFVHGLGGHAYDTWRRDTRRREAPEDVTFCPLWLAGDVDGISVYTMAYEAPPTNWLGTSMLLQIENDLLDDQAPETVANERDRPALEARLAQQDFEDINGPVLERHGGPEPI